MINNIIGIISAFFYLTAGILLVIFQSHFSNLSYEIKIAFSTVLISYSLFRAYRLYKKIKEEQYEENN
jgi:hypothetical protein